MAQSSSRKTGVVDTFVLLVLSVCVAFPGNPNILKIPRYDQGFFLYVGSIILKGGLPYKDVWDHKPPGIYYLNALGLYLGHNSMWGMWGLDILALFLAAIIGYMLLRRNWGRVPALLSIALYMSYIPFLTSSGNLTEYYALPLQFLILYLVSVHDLWLKQLRYILVGVLIAGMILLKPTVIGIPMAVLIYLAFEHTSNKKSRTLSTLWSTLGGTGLVLAPITLYFIKKGIFWEMLSDIVGEGLRYSNVSLQTHLLSFVAPAHILSVLIVLALYGCLLFVNRVRTVRETLLYISVIAFPLDIVLVNIPGRFYQHYYLTLLPVLTVLACSAISYLYQKILVRRRASAFIVLICIIIFTIAKSYMNIIDNKNWTSDKNKVVTFIEQHTSPDDTLLVWGYEPFFYFSTRRNAPTKYAFQYPLFTIGYQNSDMTAEFLTDLKLRKPRLIIDGGADTIGQMPTIASMSLDSNLTNVYRVTPDLLKVGEYIRSNYVQIATFQPNDIVVYGYKSR